MHKLILNLLMIGSLAPIPLKPLAQAQSASLATVINGNITSNTTWTQSGSPYQVQAIVTVYPGVTLTIEPGVKITFANNTRLNVNGTLLAEGRPDSQILFTAANPTPGAWQGVWIYGTSGQRSSGNRLKYVTIEYGGGGIANGANLYVSDGDISIRYSIFRNSSENGLSTWNNVVANVSDTQFTGNQGYAALFADLSSMPALARLAGSGNGVNVIALGGIGHPITGTNLWMAQGLPYQLVSSETVSPGSKLIIEPDVEVRFASHTRLDIKGSLESAGTIDHPILITGVTKIPGSWDGLIFIGPYNTPALSEAKSTTPELVCDEVQAPEPVYPLLPALLKDAKG
jgi:hypothetical protein